MARVAEKEDGGPLFTAADRTRLTYTSCYCEENAYKLVEAALAMQAADGGAPPAASEGVDHEDSAAAAETLEERSDGGRKLFVLFISSRGRAVPIWCQKAAAGPAEPVVKARPEAQP
uniref:Protein N-terminal glutamine amidohydrolase alpha beta roll domain-containing protein n=1 Tax=Phaeomonas parva TaxID=124430 RepID=A0A7S1TYC9_9STRA|mmetsp:Transcript_23064/g.71864  ORF Transcript_23064/g.71864 Transcript_23064/m.71864 type:complete len:117 (+) Transcript_23064:131-481(+)